MSKNVPNLHKVLLLFWFFVEKHEKFEGSKNEVNKSKLYPFVIIF